jgi:hypothetical protein
MKDAQHWLMKEQDPEESRDESQEKSPVGMPAAVAHRG